ncbi:glycosyltransferase [Chitinophaga deserti]|uniref:glycosyltransferase n=1 Tax=Chitinophaga deserti TaxID=2164099 RepID=UPI000D6AAB4C|nr:glycosyltransferase [Chitinophaga deserti]
MSLTTNSKHSPVGISVIICCYNSSQRIGETLRHLARQQFPEDFRYEVLLVDNDSTDDTAAVARAIWDKEGPAGIPLRIVEELRAGQMYARDKGVKEAAYDSIVFCDDDNWLNPDYVYYAWKTLRENPTVGAAGGSNYPVTDAPAYPDWFPEHADKFALGVPGEESGIVNNRSFILGAGMVTRRKLFLAMYPDEHPTLLAGRNGSKLSTGDDFEYCKRLMIAGYDLYFEKRLSLKHFIPRQRLMPEYLERLLAGINDATPTIELYDLALRAHRRNKKKNRWRMLLLSPFRIIFTKWGLMNRVLIDEKNTLYYLSPIDLGGSHEMKVIKKFFRYAKSVEPGKI